MRVLLLSDPSSIHTKRWVTGLCSKGVEVGIFGHKPSNAETEFYNKIQNCCGFWVRKDGKNIMSKILYLTVILNLKKIIMQWKPDIVHAHWATRYGLVGAFSGFHPFVTSVWGSDVLILPKKNLLYRFIINFVLEKSDYVFSTSLSMAIETKKYTNKKVAITPFGVDTTLFKFYSNEFNVNKSSFVVGNVKTLDYVYGIDILIRSFKLLVDRNPSREMKLEIVGDGPNKKEYEELVCQLGLNEKVAFLGKIDNTLLPHYYNHFDVAVFPSRSESFGVVAIESMACGCPVVVSDADGFKEVVEDGETGLVVKREDIESMASAIQRFVDNPNLRKIMGLKGRKRVLMLYSWDDNVRLMISLYHRIISNRV